MIAACGGWRATLASYRHPEVRKLLFLGYASGLPFMLVLITLGLWLRESGFTLKSIGHFSWVGLAYSLKFFWSPMVDRLRLPLLHRLGRRRSWMLLAQVCIVIGLVLQAENDPTVDPVRTVWIAIFTAFFAATQDIAIDAYRIESGSLDLQASMAAAYQIG
jgi:PAT family beta-lactamase induction signal transducer AmpG